MMINFPTPTVSSPWDIWLARQIKREIRLPDYATSWYSLKEKRDEILHRYFDSSSYRTMCEMWERDSNHINPQTKV